MFFRIYCALALTVAVGLIIQQRYEVITTFPNVGYGCTAPSEAGWGLWVTARAVLVDTVHAIVTFTTPTVVGCCIMVMFMWLTYRQWTWVLPNFATLSISQRCYLTYLRWLQPWQVTVLSDLTIEAHDEVEEELLDGQEPNPPTRRQYIAQCAAIAKATFGTPERSAANDLAIRDFLRRLMTNDRHRPSHINRDIPLAIELVYLPANSELEAIRFRHSAAAQERLMIARNARSASAA